MILYNRTGRGRRTGRGSGGPTGGTVSVGSAGLLLGKVGLDDVAGDGRALVAVLGVFPANTAPAISGLSRGAKKTNRPL